MAKHKIVLVDTEGGITAEPQKHNVVNLDHVAWDTSRLKHKEVFIKFDGVSPADGTFYLNEHGHLSLVMNNVPKEYTYHVSYEYPVKPGDGDNPTPPPPPPPPPPIIIIMDDLPQ